MHKFCFNTKIPSNQNFEKYFVLKNRKFFVKEFRVKNNPQKMIVLNGELYIILKDRYLEIEEHSIFSNSWRNCFFKRPCNFGIQKLPNCYY